MQMFTHHISRSLASLAEMTADEFIASGLTSTSSEDEREEEVVVPAKRKKKR